MRISNFQIELENGFHKISAIVDSYEVWFRVPSEYEISEVADPFLAIALLPAMSQGENIEIDSSMKVSSQFLRNIEQLQDIFHSWNPQLSKIAIDAEEGIFGPVNSGTISFFSGGVDSAYSFLKNIDKITHLVNIHGFDFLYLKSNESHEFSIEDIKDLSQFTRRIMFPQKPFGRELRDLLPQDTKDLLLRYIKEHLPPTPIEENLIRALNEIISSGKLAKKQIVVAFPRELIGKYDNVYDQTLQRNFNFATHFGKKLIPIETNHYAFGYRYNLSRNLSHGSCLGAIAALLGFPRAFIPSSYSYNQLFPLGSHPLTDPLWSNQGTTILHDGCEVGRTGKLELIAKNEVAVKNLRVCFDDSNHNCGKCAKCIRTMITLELLGASLDAFPPFPHLDAIRNAKISGEIEEAFFIENIELSLTRNNPGLHQALLDCRRKIDREKFIANAKHIFGEFIYKIDRSVLGGKIKSKRNQIAGRSPRHLFLKRIDTVPHK